ncbi:unnamed protein product [Brassica rapa]|uniref:Uncharacterized protein n=1 Tax=Brassica campestris TaxID=3711 RepID=A0A8D9M4X4_BRACM|nr:unnamed protein product [Brassica rapa]
MNQILSFSLVTNYSKEVQTFTQNISAKKVFDLHKEAWNRFN